MRHSAKVLAVLSEMLVVTAVSADDKEAKFAAHHIDLHKQLDDKRSEVLKLEDQLADANWKAETRLKDLERYRGEADDLQDTVEKLEEEIRQLKDAKPVDTLTESVVQKLLSATIVGDKASMIHNLRALFPNMGMTNARLLVERAAQESVLLDTPKVETNEPNDSGVTVLMGDEERTIPRITSDTAAPITVEALVAEG